LSRRRGVIREASKQTNKQTNKGELPWMCVKYIAVSSCPLYQDSNLSLRWGMVSKVELWYSIPELKTKQTRLHGLSPRANYTDRATAACRRSDCQLLRIEGATWSVWRIPTAVFSVL
jgi:hypothetical protein